MDFCYNHAGWIALSAIPIIILWVKSAADYGDYFYEKAYSGWLLLISSILLFLLFISAFLSGCEATLRDSAKREQQLRNAPKVHCRLLSSGQTYCSVKIDGRECKWIDVSHRKVAGLSCDEIQRQVNKGSSGSGYVP
jgi:hypothetical protein